MAWVMLFQVLVAEVSHDVFPVGRVSEDGCGDSAAMGGEQPSVGVSVDIGDSS